MNWKNPYISFTIIVSLKAIMDGLNFVIPHNTGFFSLTSGWFDAWHISWWLCLLIIAIHFVWDKQVKWQINMLGLVAFGFIALFAQLIIYNFLFKLE